jgi:hypothetical protein
MAKITEEEKDEIVRVVHMRAAQVVALPQDKRQADIDAYTAELVKRSEGQDDYSLDQARAMADAINKMTLDLVAKIEASGGGGGGHA